MCEEGDVLRCYSAGRRKIIKPGITQIVQIAVFLPPFVGGFKAMIVKTRNYRLEKKDYRRLALKNILREQWWVGLIALAICLGFFWISQLLVVYCCDFGCGVVRAVLVDPILWRNTIGSEQDAV